MSDENQEVKYESNVDELITNHDRDTYPDDPVINEEPKEPEAEDDSSSEKPTDSTDSNLDEYGNELPESEPEQKTYTQAELNERINAAVRDRLARMERNQPQSQAAENESKPDDVSAEDWQAQLDAYIDAHLDKRSQRQKEMERQQQEQRAMQEFQSRFEQGMSRFKDFTEVVGHQPVTDAMANGLRGMKDPAAFMYAASKRASDDLKRISELPDAYAQIVELGKLEAKLKSGKSASNAPKPLGNPKEDMSKGYTGSSRMSVDDLIREHDRKAQERLQRRK